MSLTGSTAGLTLEPSCPEVDELTTGMKVIKFVSLASDISNFTCGHTKTTGSAVSEACTAPKVHNAKAFKTIE